MDVLWSNCFFILACFCGSLLGNPNKCDEVRKVFQLRQIGPSQLLPLSPRQPFEFLHVFHHWGLNLLNEPRWSSRSDLQVCTSKNLTCCTKKMEERYQMAARRDIQNLLQMSSSSLKFLISRNVAAFQGAQDSVCFAVYIWLDAGFVWEQRDRSHLQPNMQRPLLPNCGP
ncbi:hypothetical protein WMY93_013480 [Mugilogobius chulae]|uniref:Glypican-3 beta subunit n=1 Tax=Mugilogobius chulae TaxID=88201 RepID=A0AAW0PBH4_9GOBI